MVQPDRMSSMMTSLGHVTAKPTPPSFGKMTGALLWSYAGPLIFVVGIVGNILILVTMAQRRMSGTSTCVYLRCMAAADLAVMITGMIPEWLDARNIIVVKVNTRIRSIFESGLSAYRLTSRVDWSRAK